MAVFAALLLAVGLLRGPLLRSAGSFLVVESHSPPSAAIFILDGDERFNVAAQRISAGATTVLLHRGILGRLERMNILPSSLHVARRELFKRGVAEDDLALVADEPIGRYEIPEKLCDWMRNHPDQPVDVLCDRFSTRKWSILMSRAADQKLRDRIHLVPLPNRAFDESNWWQSKPGTLAVLNGYLTLAFHWFKDNDHPIWTECTDADFQAAFAGRSDE